MIAAKLTKKYLHCCTKISFIECSETSQKLHKAIRQAENVSQVSGAGKNCLDEKTAKITKQYHTYKGYASTYSVEIFNSFNPELQHKDTESAIKKN